MLGARLAYMNKKELGSFGEKIAENYFKKKGYQILEKNYSFRFASGRQKGEIDIIVKKDNIIAFVEVKSLATSFTEIAKPFFSEDKINFSKQVKLIKTAETWLAKKKIPLNTKRQIDIIVLKIDLKSKKAKIKHLQNVFPDLQF